MFDETQRSQVEQRMASRLGDAWEDRQARLASGAHRGSPIRARVGRALVGIGHAIAGPSDDSTTAGRPI
jgi:hypothetical protein